MNESMDRALADWLREGPENGPREGLERALAATRRTSQRSGWSFPERWLPMQLSMARTPSMRPILAIATVALLILALGAAAVLIGSARRAAPPPFGVARNGAVVFEENGDLQIADQLGGPGRPLVSGPTRDSRPIFSNQGDRIAFLRTDPEGTAVRLLTVKPDGSGLRELAGPYQEAGAMGWSSDGSTIIVEHTSGSTRAIAAVRTDGSGARDLDVGMSEDLATARPGSSQIAFRGQTSDGPGVFMVNADGTGLQRIGLPRNPGAAIEYEFLSWSPDGSRLLYANDHDSTGTDGWRTTVADIDRVGHVTSVRELALVPGSTAELVAGWSPDGRSLSFVLERDGLRQVAIASADETRPVTLIGPSVTAGASGFGHAWSPDGQRMMIEILPRGAPQQFWSVDVATGEREQLDGFSEDLPTWQRLPL